MGPQIVTDPWCSSGALTVDGSLLSTGGFGDGDKSVRTIGPCKTCDWEDIPNALGSPRWYHFCVPSTPMNKLPSMFFEIMDQLVMFFAA